MSRFKITPIGTCRIHNPVRGAAGKYPVTYEVPRTYGYTHTSAEALQQLDFLQGKIAFPEHLTPGIFRNSARPDDVAGRWDGAHLVPVEISSLKLLSAEGFWLQTRYLSTHFADFFASPARSKPFWVMAERDPAALQDFLDRDPVYSAMSDSDKRLLGAVRLQQQSFEQLREDMEALTERIGADRILFITHVNALDPNGRTIPSREKLIRWVEQVAQDLEVPCFNPTDLVRDYGQDRAMARGGLDTTHYTDPFYTTVYGELHRHFIAPMAQRVLGTSAEDGDVHAQMLADAIAATLEHVDLVTGARQLHAALRAHPNSTGLIELRGVLREKLGEFEGAIADLAGPLLQNVSLANGSREALMRACVEVGDAGTALRVADELIDQEHESLALHRTAARAAAELGLHDRVIEHSKQVARLDRSDIQTAIRVLDDLWAEGGAIAAEWRDELLYFAANDAKLSEALARFAAARTDAEFFGNAIATLAALNPTTAGDMIVQINDPELRLAARGAIGAVLTTEALPSRLLRALRDIGREWTTRAVELSQRGSFDEAYPLAMAALSALGSNGGNKALRTLGAAMLTRARELAADGKLDEVLRLCDGKAEAAMERPRLAIEFARALQAAGRDDEAVKIACDASDRSPEDVPVAVTSARLLRDRDVAAAARKYAAVEQADSDGRYAQEIEQFRSIAGKKAAEQIKLRIDGDDFAAALDLLPLIAAQDSGRANQMRTKLHQALRSAIKTATNECDTHRKRELLDLLLTVQPDDAPALRDAAVTAMKHNDFATALGYWERLSTVTPDVDAVEQGLVRCRLLASSTAGRDASLRVQVG